MDYVTKSLSGYGLTKAYLTANFAANEDLEDFVTLTLNNESLIFDGEELFSEPQETHYYGFLREDESVLDIVNMDTGNYTWFVRE